MQSCRCSGKERTLFGAGFIADSNNAVELFAGLDHFRYSASFFISDIDADFPQHRYGQWIERSRLESGAFSLKSVPAQGV